MFEWFKNFFFGRKAAKAEILEERLRARLRLCRAAGKRPEGIVNFWEGLEDLCGALRHHLNDWVDWDAAQFYLAVGLGIMKPGMESALKNKHVFWTDNELGNRLFRLLGELADAGILEHRKEPDIQFRYGPTHFRCPDCGAHVKADEDECCATCGADCEVEDCRCEKGQSKIHDHSQEDRQGGPVP